MYLLGKKERLAIFLTSVIGHFVLTRSLQPLLDQTAAEPNSDVRIVVVRVFTLQYSSCKFIIRTSQVGSDAHEKVSVKPRFRGVDDFNLEFKNALIPSFARYGMFFHFLANIRIRSHNICSQGYSKLANILYAFELQRRLIAAGSPITVICIHPGRVDTVSHKPPLSYFKYLLLPLIYLLSYKPDQGAYTSVFAAASEEVSKQRDKYKGAYLVPMGKIADPTDFARDEELAKELWSSVEKFLEEKGV